MNRPLEPNEPRTTSTIVEPFTQSSVDKIDLLLMIDNSRSMADKQQILANAVADLVGALVLPKCLDDMGVPAASQPTDPLAACPAGTKHEFPPVLDIHIGIVTSSLGGHGGDACAVAGDPSCGNGMNPSNNDASHLISRQDACGGQLVPTYKMTSGFLAWDPSQKLMPPGEKTLGDLMNPGLVKSLHDMVIGVGQIGCGYEASLEAWYRFLVDPEPYQSISVVNGKATPSGTDNVLLQQRADFLRSSSLLAIIMLTDENDCSTKEYGQFYYMAQTRQPGNPKAPFYLPNSRSECDTNPNDKCCKSCGQNDPSCPADAKCMAMPTLDSKTDTTNLRCFDNKRRFGIDFLYPIDRYTQALTSLQVPNRAGELVPNPLFTDLNPNDSDTNIRDASLVFLAGIVGVPWQLIARDPANLSKGFKNSDELINQKDGNGNNTWDNILGDPANYVAPKDPHMIESIQPRAGLPPPNSAPDADPYNGHEFSVPLNDDLQYACIFKLPQARDCSGGAASCDCANSPPDNPLCDPAMLTSQVKAKGYPGVRELTALRSLGTQGIVGSICPAQLDTPGADDYGYRPAVGAIIERLKVALKGKCLPRQLNPDPNTGQVQCLILEARNSGGKCSCDPTAARRDVQESHKGAIDAAKEYPIAKTAKWDCFCEIVQAGDTTDNPAGSGKPASSKEALQACQNDTSSTPVIMGGAMNGQQVNGWCYVDATTSPPTGNTDIVKDCPATEKRLVRFVGNGGPSGGSTLFITCSGE